METGRMYTRADSGTTASRRRQDIYRSLTSEQLLLERKKKCEQLAQLTRNPGPAAEVGRLFVTLDADVDLITVELVRRGVLHSEATVSATR